MAKYTVAAIIPAAGRGTRLKQKTPKAFVEVAGKPLFIHTLFALKKAYPFFQMIVALDPSMMEKAKKLLKKFKISADLAVGGATRAESVWNALQAVSPSCAWVAVHDAARPLISGPVVQRTIEEALRSGGALCALPATATVKRVNLKTRRVIKTENRDSLYLAQTPQVFKKEILVKRYKTLGQKAFQATDEAALFDGSSQVVNVVTGDPKNIKITTPEDLEFFERWHRLRHSRA